jgi:uncharacterized membrane protein
MNEHTNDGSEAEHTAACESDAGKNPERTLAVVREIEEKLDEARLSLPPEDRKQVKLVVKEVISKEQLFVGPQPPPELLREYENIAPGSASKLLQMGFDEQKHRHAWEMRILSQKDELIRLDRCDFTYAMAGLVLGFLALLAILGVGVYALTIGHVKIAAACLTGSFAAAAASVFINGRIKKLPKEGNQNQSPGDTEGR